METRFINRNTGTYIPEDSIHSELENGIITDTGNSWKFIPEKELKRKYVYDEYYRQEDLPPMRPDRDTDPFLVYENEEDENYTEKAEYRFGFSDLRFVNRQTAPVSGIISEPIDIEGCEYITVSCDADTEGGAIEIYIVDGTEETPILPEGMTEIKQEKLFYNQNTRFIADINNPIILYQDGKVLDKDYTGIKAEQFHCHTYTLSYTALGESGKYTPVGNEIRVKLIIRQYQNLPMVRVHSLTVNQYGGTLEWNSNP